MELPRSVVFQEIDAYLEEIGDDAPDIDDLIVRCDVEIGNNGEVLLRSSYVLGIAVRELILSCGTTPGGRHEDDGRKVHAGHADTIKKFCLSKGLKFKKGIAL